MAEKLEKNGLTPEIREQIKRYLQEYQAWPERSSSPTSERDGNQLNPNCSSCLALLDE